MTREEMWKEFENQLIRETRTSITMSYDVSERMTKSAIEITVAKWKNRLEQEPCEMTAEEYRKRMIQAFHNSDCDELIAVCVLPTEKEFEHLEWLLKNHYKQEPCEDAINRQNLVKDLRFLYDQDGYIKDNRAKRTMEVIMGQASVTLTRKKGKWIKVTETEFGIGYQCSECGRFILTESIDRRKLKDYPYCHCGAKMEVDIK